MNKKMFEAHVAFEMQRWQQSMEEEVTAAFGWFGEVRLGDILTADALLEIIDAWPGPDLTMLREVHAAAGADETPIGDLVRREDYDRLVSAVMDLGDVREAVVDQVTTSEVYSELITHVLYHGIKNYVMTQSPVTKVPGASAFMRLGQSAMDIGAPKLSKGIDRQLMSFVNSNISDSLRESRNYLTSAVDERAAAEVTGEIWNSNADTTVAELAALIPSETVVEIAGIGVDMWQHLRTTDAFRDQVARWLDENSDRTVADVVADAGVDAEQVIAAVTPWLAAAAQDGHLESRIRAHLEPFYAQYGQRK